MRTLQVDVGGGHRLCVDDTGDPDGVPVLFIHGTPDSRLGRHPDDMIAASLGVRLLAVDRPGFGGSTAVPGATPGSFGHQLGTLLVELGAASCFMLGWSAGSLWALGAAASLGERVTGLGIVAGLVPCEAYDARAVLDAAPEARRAMLDTAAELGAAQAAALIGPMLVPDPPTIEAAREQLRLSHDATTRAELEAVPGASELMARAMIDSVRHGTAGLIRDVEVQMTPGLFDLAAIRCPTLLWYGEVDTSTPVPFGEWLVARLPHASLRIVAGASHALLLPCWRDLLVELVSVS